jgi:hypothetical protein
MLREAPIRTLPKTPSPAGDKAGQQKTRTAYFQAPPAAEQYTEGA